MGSLTDLVQMKAISSSSVIIMSHEVKESAATVPRTMSKVMKCRAEDAHPNYRI